jgi:hypothetical protein
MLIATTLAQSLDHARRCAHDAARANPFRGALAVPT